MRARRQVPGLGRFSGAGRPGPAALAAGRTTQPVSPAYQRVASRLMGPSGGARPGTGVPPDPRGASAAQRADPNLGETLPAPPAAVLGVPGPFAFFVPP